MFASMTADNVDKFLKILEVLSVRVNLQSFDAYSNECLCLLHRFVVNFFWHLWRWTGETACQSFMHKKFWNNNESRYSITCDIWWMFPFYLNWKPSLKNSNEISLSPIFCCSPSAFQCQGEEDIDCWEVPYSLPDDTNLVTLDAWKRLHDGRIDPVTLHRNRLLKSKYTEMSCALVCILNFFFCCLSSTDVFN